MSKSRIITGGLLLLVSVLILGACTPGNEPSAPTVDTNMIFTAAAQTVQAQLSETAAAAPTATDTPVPTETTAALEVPTLAPVGQQVDETGLLTATAIFTLGPLPGAATATAGLPAGPSSVTAQWVSNEPADNTEMYKGQKFDIRWTIRNVGTKTWNKDYYIQFAWGDKLTEKNKYFLREEVKPDSTTTVIADGIAPSKGGEYTTWWKVKDAEGNNIGDITLTITVGGPTATPDYGNLCDEKSFYNDHTDACDKFCTREGDEYCWGY